MTPLITGGASTGLHEPWPVLPVASWQPTRDTLHLWTQVVGKARLALAPPQNHWWNVPLYPDARGLTTSLMPLGPRGGLEVRFDLRDHHLDLLHTDGRRCRLRLEPRTVADFYAEFRDALAALDVEVDLNPMPTEIAGAVPFDTDHTHTAYDPDAVQAFAQTLVSAHRVLAAFRGEFRGKSSPVHFFWGAFDLAVTRFSGRPAPVHPGGVPHCPDWVMVEAYNAEVSSCGYWPGGAEEGVFYAYAYPEPPGFAATPLDGPGHYDGALGEYVLPYADVRRATDPDGYLTSFLRAAHRRASADWPPEPG